MRSALFGLGERPAGRNRNKGLNQHPWLLGVGMATVLCVAYLIEVGLSWSDAGSRSLYANIGMIPIGVAATIVARSAALDHTEPRARWAWRLIAAAFACFCGGDILFFVYQNVLGRSPFPSLADAGYLVYYPLMLAGLLFLPGRPGRPAHMGRRLAACAVLFLGGGVSVTEFLLLPTLGDSSAGTFLYSLSLGYPVGDLFLLAGIVSVVLRAAGGRCLTVFLLTAGVCVGLFADIVFGYQNVQGTSQPGGLSDALFMGSWLFFAWAAYAEATRRAVKRSTGAQAGGAA